MYVDTGVSIIIAVVNKLSGSGEGRGGSLPTPLSVSAMCKIADNEMYGGNRAETLRGQADNL